MGDRARSVILRALRVTVGFLVVLSVLLIVSSPSHGGVLTADLEQALSSALPDEQIPIIVVMKDRVDLAQFENIDKRTKRENIITALKNKAAVTQTSVMAISRTRNAQKVKSLWIINGIAMKANPALIETLGSQPNVAAVQLDTVVTLPEPTVAAELAAPEWNIQASGAPVLWSLGYTGQGVVVANMDTGVDVLHPDLAARWRGGSNSWFDPNNEHPVTPYDNDGHGTQTMGIMVGGDSGGTTIGMAPGAQWIAVKIFNDAGATLNSTIHQGFQYLLDPDGSPSTDDAPHIVNLSWTLDNPGDCSNEFQEDINVFRASGIAVVVAAGNFGNLGEFSSTSPANNGGALSVGAVTNALGAATFSSRGPSACNGGIFPSLTAPGIPINTSDLTLGGTSPDPYLVVFGTSFAAPHVAGAMALLLEAHPTLTVYEMEQALLYSATDLGASGPDDDYGYGLLDVSQAHSLLELGLSACKGDLNRDGVVNGTDLALFKQDFGVQNCVDVVGCGGDLNVDGVVDGKDLHLFAGEYGTTGCLTPLNQ